MNKVTIFGILFVCLFVKKGIAFDREMIWKDWRSSETTSAETDVSIATGNIYMKDVIVASGTAGFGQIQFFNSSGTVADGVSRTSSTVYEIDTAGDIFPIDQIYSKGLRYTKTGVSAIVIRWDWVTLPPPALRDKGLK